MRKAFLTTLLALATLAAACTSTTAPAAHDCVNGTWNGSGQPC